MKYFSALKGGWFWAQRVRGKEKKTKGKKSLLKSLKQLASHIYIPKNYGIENTIQFRQKCLRNKHCKDDIYTHDMTPHNLIINALSDASHSVYEIVYTLSLVRPVKKVNSLVFTNYQEAKHICILKFWQTLCLTSALALILPCFLVSCISCSFFFFFLEIHAIH